MTPARKSSSSRSSQEKESAPFSIDYDHLRRLCLKYWQWLAGAVVLGAVGGLVWAAFQTTIYEARSTIVVQGSKDASLQGVPDLGRPDATSSTDELKTVEQLLLTRDLLERVVKSEHLNEDPDFLGTIPAPVSEEAATSILSGEVNIRNRPLTRLIDISVEHHSPQMAKRLADALAQASITQEFDQNTTTAKFLSDDLQKEVTELEQKVAQSEQALHDYQASHKESGAGVSLDDKDDIVDANLKDLNQKYLDAQAQVTLLKERYGEQHPKLIQAEKIMEELGNEMRKAQDGVLDSNSLSIEYNRLKSTADSYKLQLTNLQNALNGAQVATQVTNPGISVAEVAQLPLYAVRPSKSKAVAMGGFLGIICGLGFILGIYFMDTSIRTVSQAENTLGLPVIAAVPILTETDGSTILPTFSDPQSFVAESFRGLRASLLLHDRENPLKTILVCSAIPGEGKSFCTANLAVAFAQAG